LHLQFDTSHFPADHCSELVVRVFSQLHQVFIDPDPLLATIVRTRIVRIVESCLLMVGIEAHIGNHHASQLLETNMTQWMELFLAHIVSAGRLFALPIQILKTLTAFIQVWPSHMSAVLAHILPRLYTLLGESVPAFEHVCRTRGFSTIAKQSIHGQE
jgi:importin-9